MTPADEATFLRNFASAMCRSGDVASLDKLWRSYDEEIAKCSPAGQTDLQRLRIARGKEMMGAKS